MRQGVRGRRIGSRMRRGRRRGYRRRKKKRGGGVGRKGRYRAKNEIKRDQEDPVKEKKDTQKGREENIKDVARGRNMMQRVRVDWQRRKGGETERAVLRSDGDAWSGAKGEIAKMKMIEKMKR